MRIENGLHWSSGYGIPDYDDIVRSCVSGCDPLLVWGDDGGLYLVAMALEELLGFGFVIVDDAGVGTRVEDGRSFSPGRTDIVGGEGVDSATKTERPGQRESVGDGRGDVHGFKQCNLIRWESGGGAGLGGWGNWGTIQEREGVGVRGVGKNSEETTAGLVFKVCTYDLSAKGGVIVPTDQTACFWLNR